MARECKAEYTKEEALVDYGRILALKEIVRDHPENASREALENYFGLILNRMTENGYAVDMQNYLMKKNDDGIWEVI